jgi:nucleotide-binding universal stress UspA family protein
VFSSSEPNGPRIAPLESASRREPDMPSFHHILFPVDFSESCRAVTPFVRSIAEKCGAKVTLMHVIQASYSGVDLTYPSGFDVEAALRRDGEHKLADFFEHPDASVVQVGEPAAAIVEYAAKNGIDLIMMPTHGYGMFRRLLLGSVTAKVLYDTARPVWTAAHTDDPSLPGHAKCENILCAVDLTADDVPTMRRSLELARFAKLRFVHAVPPAEPTPEGFDEKFRRAMIELARQELAKMQREAETDVPGCVESGTVSHLVREAALQHGADLVVIGRGKLHKNLGRLRTNAYAIIRDSP